MIGAAAGYVVPWVEMQGCVEDGRALPHGTEGLPRVKSPDMAEDVLPAARQIDPRAWFNKGYSIRALDADADGLLALPEARLPRSQR